MFSLLSVFLNSIMNNKSFQEILFYDSGQGECFVDFVNKIKPDIVYFDTIRCASYVYILQKTNPNCKIVVDFDDMMSDRYFRYSFYAKRFGLNIGYIEKFLGSTLTSLVSKFPAAGWLLKREGTLLAQAEISVGRVADRIIFASSLEAQNFRLKMVDRPEIVEAIPQLFVKFKNIELPMDPLRFIFVGSDSQIQNSLVIDYLCHLWVLHKPRVQLHIYGRQKRIYKQVDNIIFCGFEPDYGRIYSPNSIALVPAIIEGGVKTKVMEALAYGIPIVTNKIGVQGLPFYDLNIGFDLSDEELIRVVNNPEIYIEDLCQKSKSAQNVLSEYWGYSAYNQRINQIFGGLLNDRSV